MIIFKIIKEKSIWEDFILECREKTFLSSWNWGEFNKMMENKIWRLGICNNEELVGIALVIKIIAKRGTFLLIPHGPNILSNYQTPNFKGQILKALLEELKKIAKQEKTSFVRIAPLWERNEENEKIFKKIGFRKAPMHISAYEATLKLNLSLSEEILLNNMRKTTRYLIRQAMKDPAIVIEKSQRVEDIEIYQKLSQETGQRQKFVPFSFEFIKSEFEIFAKENQALWFFGKYQQETMAGALILFWSKIGFYHQAALSIKCPPKIPLAYLLQWEAIKEAKKRGCVLYDFWGYTDPKSNPNHPWAGPTLFKMGFGGYKKEYIRTQDFIFSNRYWLTWLFEKIRKIKRRL